MNRLCRKSQAGFTLIELTTVVAIIGVLVALVTPMFKDYLIETKVTELDSVAYGAKLSIDEFVLMNGHFPATENDVDLNPLTRPKYLQNMSWNNTILTLEANSALLGLPPDQELSLVYEPLVTQGDIEWVCKAYGATKFAPANCDDGI